MTIVVSFCYRNNNNENELNRGCKQDRDNGLCCDDVKDRIGG